jgi:hypothetical protein
MYYRRTENKSVTASGLWSRQPEKYAAEIGCSSLARDEYGEVFGAFKCRGRAPVFELVGQTGISLPSAADFFTH